MNFHVFQASNMCMQNTSQPGTVNTFPIQHRAHLILTHFFLWIQKYKIKYYRATTQGGGKTPNQNPPNPCITTFSALSKWAPIKYNVSELNPTGKKMLGIALQFARCFQIIFLFPSQSS